MKMQYKRILASVLFVLISFVCVSQTLPPPGPPPPGPGFPIDGGVMSGIAFAIFYGVRKLVLKKK